MSEERLRLRKLLEHWIQHNDEHKNRFEESAREATRMGLDKVSEDLLKAAESAGEVSSHLKGALNGF